MTLNANMALLVGAFSLTVVGCGSKVEETGEPTDTSVGTTDTSDTTTTTTTTDDTALFTYFWAGAAAVDNDGTAYTEWDGSESFIIYNVTEAKAACTETYTMLSTTPMAGCDNCSFAFDITMSDSVVSGDGCSTFGFADQAGEIGSIGWGLAETYVLEDGTELDNILMYYYPGGQEWFGVAAANVTPQGAGMTLDYTIYTQYYFYYYTY